MDVKQETKTTRRAGEHAGGRAGAAAGSAGTPGRAPLKPDELLWVTCTTALILFLALSPQLFVLWPYFRRTPTFTARQLLHALAPFNAGIAAIFYNYRLCIVSSPGRTPHGWQPDWDALGIDPPHQHSTCAHTAAKQAPSDESLSSESSTDGEGEDDEDEGGALLPKEKRKRADPLAVPRFCKTCDAYKPPRAHHCKHCKACTLRMDHHCPWIANCVGHGNAPHFLRFLYAVQYSILYHFALLSARIADWWSPPGAFWIAPGNAEMVLILLNYIAGIIVLLLVGVFCIYHTWLLCSGTTTIESSERDRVRTMVRRGRIREIRYPFDLGAYANICAVLGPTPLHWVIPGLRTQRGDGLMYDCRQGTPSWLPYAWPPRDPTHPLHNHYAQGGSNAERRIDRRALRKKRDELERGWEWERNRHRDYLGRGEEEEDADDDDYDHEEQVAAAYATGTAFTYGAERLNPGLRPSNSYQRRAEAHSPHFDANGGGGGGEDGLRTRVRRGSEGLEVKPRRFDLAFAHEQREWERAQNVDAQLAQDMMWPSADADFSTGGLPSAFDDDDADDTDGQDEASSHVE
ncbi:Palmitoyltransferase [Tilletia horrida]|nr:Palmitoyltransferase [Tilletia horrida]